MRQEVLVPEGRGQLYDFSLPPGADVQLRSALTTCSVLTSCCPDSCPCPCCPWIEAWGAYSKVLPTSQTVNKSHCFTDTQCYGVLSLCDNPDRHRQPVPPLAGNWRAWPRQQLSSTAPPEGHRTALSSISYIYIFFRERNFIWLAKHDLYAQHRCCHKHGFVTWKAKYSMLHSQLHIGTTGIVNHKKASNMNISVLC